MAVGRSYENHRRHGQRDGGEGGVDTPDVGRPLHVASDQHEQQQRGQERGAETETSRKIRRRRRRKGERCEEDEDRAVQRMKRGAPRAACDDQRTREREAEQRQVPFDGQKRAAQIGRHDHRDGWPVVGRVHLERTVSPRARFPFGPGEGTGVTRGEAVRQGGVKPHEGRRVVVGCHPGLSTRRRHNRRYRVTHCPFRPS